MLGTSKPQADRAAEEPVAAKAQSAVFFGPADSGIDYGAVFLRGWRVLIAGLFAGGIAGLVLLQILPQKFSSWVLVEPNTQSLTNISSRLGALGSLSSMVGLNLGGDADSEFSEYKTLLTSQAVADRLFQYPEIPRTVFEDQWDTKRANWHRPLDPVALAAQFARLLAGLASWEPPKPEDLRRYLERKLDIDEDFKTGFVRTKYAHKDADFARHLVTLLHREADRVIRQRALSRSQQRIDYLNTQLAAEARTDQRDVIIQLLSAESQNMMMASVDQNYAAVPIEQPFASSVPSSPNGAAIGFGAAAAGLGLAALFLLGKSWGLIPQRSRARHLQSLVPRRFRTRVT